MILDWFNTNVKRGEIEDKEIIEVGSLNVNGSVRKIIQSFLPKNYIGLDLQNGTDVDLVLPAEKIVWYFGPKRFDVAISTETIEHVVDWRVVIENMKGVLKCGGYIYLSVPTIGFGYHEYPYDCWRYETEDMEKIFADFNIIINEKISDGIFLKAQKPQNYTPCDLSNIALYSMATETRTVSIPKPKNMPTLTIGVTTYKLHEYSDLYKLTEQCLQSIISQKTQYPISIIISDQRTNDETLEKLKKYGTIIHEETDNVSHSWNLICEQAFQQGQYCLILNNDLLVFDNSLDCLLEFAKNNPRSIITSPKTFDFSAFLISKQIYNEVGAFDENLKGGSLEDWDYTVRIQEKGVSILPCSTFKVLHVANATKNHVSQDPEICKLLEESKIYYRNKWGDGKHKLP
jgi:SAM-dependent methyltransferase